MNAILDHVVYQIGLGEWHGGRHDALVGQQSLG